MNKIARTTLRKIVSAARVKCAPSKETDIQKVIDKVNNLMREGKAEYNSLSVLHNFVHSDRALYECKECRIVLGEMMENVPGAPALYVRPQQMPTFAKLLSVLEDLYLEEENKIRLDKHPSANDIKRWALKLAVLQYYRSLGVDPQESITDVAGSLITKHELAPNKEKIYDMWMNILDSKTRATDKYFLDFGEFDEAKQRGTEQGGAFEKLLDRDRIEFMTKLWQEFKQ